MTRAAGLSQTQGRIAAGMTERDLQANIVKLAGYLGYRVYHTYDSRRSDKGWPDLALAKTGRFLVIEVKREDGHISTEQAGWLLALDRAGVETHVFRPSQWLDNTIQEVLMLPCRPVMARRDVRDY